MPKQNVYLQSFNAGVVDAENLARVDLERMRLAAEDQTNFLATTTGNMFLRPGLGLIDNTPSDEPAWLREFIFSADDAALLQFTDGEMRVIVDDEVVTRPAVSTVIDRGDFSATGAWVLNSSAGADVEISSNRLYLQKAFGSNSSVPLGSSSTARQQVTVALADQGVEHALRIVIERGPVTFRCGSTSGIDDLIEETELKSGTHSLAFTPADTFWVFFKSATENARRVTSCQIEAAGDMVVPSLWPLANLPSLRFAQSADVTFVACSGVQQQRIERRSRRSWSIVDYNADDGPFQLSRSAPTRLKVSDTRGGTTLSSSDNFFRPEHVGAIFRIFNNGQHISQLLSGDQIFSDPIRVTGLSADTYIADDRDWTYSISGTWNDELKCQRSYDSEDFGFKNYRKSADSGESSAITSNVTNEDQYEDDDNAIVYYRIGFANGYSSGTARVEIDYDGGGGYGICRVLAYSDRTTVFVEVLKPFKDTVFSNDWLEGMWSQRQEYPTAVALSEGRLFWAGDDKFWASVSDAYESFDEEIEGDSGPINRSIAIGGVNEVQWLLPLQRVVIGTNGLEVSAKSSSFDEPLSPTNLSLKSASSVGSGPVDAIKIDGKGIFVDRTLKALYELIYSAEANDYVAYALTRLCASWFSSGIVQLAVSRRPDTRVWAVMADGTCMCMLYEPLQEVVAFIPITTDGNFTSVAVLPGTEQDNVYFVVERTIGGATKRFVEKMATDAEAKTGNVSKVMDSFVTGTNAPASATIGGLGHLIGKQVKVWADGAPITEVISTPKGDFTEPKLFTVSGAGTVTLDSPVSAYCVGLPYDAAFKSARLAYAAAGGTAMLQEKRINQIGIIASHYVRSGIRHGKSLDDLMPLPALSEYAVPDDVNSSVKEEKSIAFAGDWDTDSRLCLTAKWPVNFMGLVLDIDTNG